MGDICHLQRAFETCRLAYTWVDVSDSSKPRAIDLDNAAAAWTCVNLPYCRVHSESEQLWDRRVASPDDGREHCLLSAICFHPRHLHFGPDVRVYIVTLESQADVWVSKRMCGLPSPMVRSNLLPLAWLAPRSQRAWTIGRTRV